MPSGNSKSKELKWYWKAFIIADLVFLAIYFFLSPKSNFNPKWQEPVRLKSENGLLEVNLDAKKSLIKIGGKEVELATYNGSYPGQTWEVKQGDMINARIQNNLKEPTNLEFQNSDISSKKDSAEVALISPGNNFNYQFDLAKVSPGIYWYGPIASPLIKDQILSEMAGAIIVRGNVDNLPEIKHLPEKLIVLMTQKGSDPNTPNRLVNGMKNPELYLRPGETVRMEIINTSADPFNLLIPGYKLQIFSRNGDIIDQIKSIENEMMEPGQSIQFIFTPTWYGKIPVKSLYLDLGSKKYVEDTFMSINVMGLPMIPKKLPNLSR